MSWIPVLPVLFVTAGLVVIPGFLVALALRFRGFSAVALAPAFSSALVGVFGILGGLLGVRWSLWLYLGGTALTCIVARFATAVRTQKAAVPEASERPVTGWKDIVAPLAAVTVAAAMVSRRVMQLVGQPDNFAQNFDNVFHLNAIRHILVTGDASSLTLGKLQDPEAGGLYPAVWHSFAALTVQLTDASVALAENSVNITAASIVWTLSCIFLARSVFGNNPLITLAAGVLSASQIAFPFLLLVWGPLFPNTLSTSMLPLLLGIVVRLARGGALDGDQTLQRSWWMAFLVALAGATTAHMSVVNALLAFSLPLIVTLWWTALRKRTSRTSRTSRKSLVLFGLWSVLGVIVWALLWLYLRPGPYDNWGPHDSTGGAIGEALTNSPMGTHVNWLVTVLSLAGVLYLFRIRTHRWLIASYALAVVFYVVDASQDRGFLRSFLTGNWYQDTYRVAAFLPIFQTVLGAVGVWAIVVWVRAVLPRNSVTRMEDRWAKSRTLRVLVLTVFTAGLAVPAYFSPVQLYIQSRMDLYAFNEGSALLTPSELKLLEEVHKYVPDTAVIADNPWNGSSMAYAFYGREVLTPHLFASQDPERILISAELDEFTPGVCAAVVQENVEYVLDFGKRALSDTGGEYEGVTDLSGKLGFELVRSTAPEANLYKVTGCE